MTDADYPWEPPLAGTEAEHLVGALDRLRTTFRWKADGLDIIGVGTQGDQQLAGLCDRVLSIPDVPAALQPFLTVLPLQLMSYAIAVAKGNDVDQARNLAKSVTVE